MGCSGIWLSVVHKEYVEYIWFPARGYHMEWRTE